MNELIGSFAGKRLAAFGALIAAIALLAAGGALSTGTADAQTPANFVGDGLDLIAADGSAIDATSISLAVGTRAHVCLMDNIHGQRYRPDSTDGGTPDEPGDPADGDNTQVDSDKDGDTEAADDIDDFDWGIAADSIADPDDFLEEVGPQGIRTTRPMAGGSTAASETAVTGWQWVIETVTGTGSPTITNPVRTFPNNGHVANGAEACVHWTSNAPGTQGIRLYWNQYVAATSRTYEDQWDDRVPHATDAGKNRAGGNLPEIRITWVDSDPLIRISRATGATRNGVPVTAAVTAAIDQRMVFTGAGADAVADDPATDDEDESAPAVPAQSFQPADNADGDPSTVTLEVEAVQSALVAQALTGASVSFAVSGNCGSVNVPGAVRGTDRTGDLAPGQTGVVSSWPASNLSVVFSNTGLAGAACKMASSNTTLTVTSGSATNTATVNWNWDGYGVFTMVDVNETTKQVTFHTAVPRMYNALGQAVGWECKDASKARVLTFDVDGRATLAGGLARSGSIDTITAVTPISQGRATPQRTLAAMDSECQYTWTIRSPSRAADVYVDISTVGVDAYSQVLSFAPEAAPVTTFDDLEDPLDPGIDFILWTGEDAAVADAIGDSGATAVYYWVSATQSWLSFFPGSAGLGVNSLTTLQQGEIYVVSTPSN